MTYVLDTNLVSAFMRHDLVVGARLRAIGRSAVTVPQPVLAELAYGVARLPASRRKVALEADLEVVRTVFPRMPWTDEVTDQFAKAKADLERRGERIEDFDLAIAAHALAADAVLVTANRKHMLRIRGLTVEDWSV